MPLTANYTTISGYVAAQITGINATNVGGAQTVIDHLLAQAPIVQNPIPIQNHFPAGWLNTIWVRVMATLPAPVHAVLPETPPATLNQIGNAYIRNPAEVRAYIYGLKSTSLVGLGINAGNATMGMPAQQQ
jgi:hypothetical protein